MLARRSIVIGVALVGAALLAVLPAVLPAGPAVGLDASGLLDRGELWVASGVVFLGGLLTALTPCVYPLIPITVSVFGARKAKGRAQALALTSAYVVGMGVVFSALGVAAALSGKAFGSVLGSPWVAVGIALFLFALASSMFGAFELQLPYAWTTRLNQIGGAGLGGALLMGSVSGFLAAPCTGPVLAGVLTWVSTTQSAVLGAGLLFVYALGIGVPFFLLGVFTVQLPKGGVWMEWVKSVFGIALVALAIGYLRDAFPPLREAVGGVSALLGRVPGAAVAAALLALGVLLGAVHRSFKEDRRQFALKSAGVGVVVAAIVLRLGATHAPAQGALWVALGLAQPVDTTQLQWHLVFPEKKPALSLTSDPFDRALEAAKRSGKPVMIDFYADWCEACKELDRNVYMHPTVIEESKHFINIKVDGTNGEDAIEKLYARFGVKGLPTISFIDANGQLLDDPKVTGYLPPQTFLQALKKARCGPQVDAC